MDMEATTSVMPMLSLAMADMAMQATPGPAMEDTAMVATLRSAMVTDMAMDMVVKATVTAATAAQATPTMDMGVTTSVMPRLSLAMEDTAMGATPGSATVMGMVATAMVTAAIAGQAIPTMDMEATTSVMPMLSLAMADTAMVATLGSAMVTDMDMDMVVKATVTAATAAQATPTMDMGVTTSVTPRLSQAMEVMATEATPGSATVTDMDMDMVATAMVTAATAGPAIPTVDMEATTSVMLMLSLAMADMAMEVTLGPAMVVTPTCTDLHKGLVHHMDTDHMVMVTTKLNQAMAKPTTKPPMQKSHPVLPYGPKKCILLQNKPMKYNTV